MNKTKVYDLPTRLFHWLFAGLFVGAFAFAKLSDNESPLFSQHMLLGILLTALTVLRVGWGIFGSKYARFSSLPLNPLRLLEYFRDILTGHGKQHVGHNPASAWAAVIMLLLALGLGVTGYLMSTGQKEAFEDVHEFLADAFAFVVVAHIAGVVLHQFRHRDGIAFSMIHGKKESADLGEGIRHSNRLAAIGLAGVMGAFAFHVYRNYDPSQSTTSVFGVKLQLGENEGGEYHGGGESGEREHDDDDD